MQNRWNLDILFHSEEEWQQAIERLPEMNREICDLIPLGKKALSEILVQMEAVARLASRCEIWLARLVCMYPADSYLASLSDRLDRVSLLEIDMTRQVQRMLQEITEVKEWILAQEELRPFLPYLQQLLRTPIARETLTDELGGGWFRVQKVLADASVDYMGHRIEYWNFRDIASTYEWMETSEAEWQIAQRFYEQYGETAGRILLAEVRRDELDLRETGEDSLQIYLRSNGYPMEAVEAMLEAIDEALPVLWDCERLLGSYLQNVCEIPSEENSGEGMEARTESEESMEARNRELYLALRDSMLSRADAFAPGYRAAVEDAFDGDWIWIDDDPMAYTNQHCAQIPECEHSYIHMPSELEYGGLAHELGHAWCNRLQADQSVLIRKNDILVEFPSLLAEYWEREQAGDLFDRLDIIHVNVFLAASEFRFEEELRSRITQEEITVDAMSAMYRKYKKVLHSEETRERAGNPMGWVLNAAFYDIRNYYNLPYAVDLLLAMRCCRDLRDLAGEERDAYWNRLEALLHELNQRPAGELLEGFFGESICRVEFWRDCLQDLEEICDEIRMVQG